MTAIARWLVIGMALLMSGGAMAENRVPNERLLETLVKSTLLTFNDANVTRNYTVFHARSAKLFRDKLSPENLKQIFKEFAEQQVNIGTIAALKPTYDQPPTIDSDGKLLVKGYFPSEPARVHFDLRFVPSEDEWKVISIEVETR